MQYDKNRNTLSILENANIHIDADDGKPDSGPTEVTSATALFLRSDRLLQFTGTVRIRQGTETMQAEAAAARISPDEKRVETLELHTNARIDVASPAPGALQTLAGTDMTLTYAADGQSLQRALIVGDAAAQLAGEPGTAGRQVVARVLDVTMAPDGSTPVSLSGQDNVRLTLPADASTPARTIDAPKMDSKGEPGRGLTRSTFTGGVQFREKGPTADRIARSATLEAAMQPGMGAIDEARFIHAARFQDGTLTAQGAQALYDVSKGTLQLTGSEPGFTTPRVVNDRIAVDATRIDVGLDGPVVKATGAVKSTLKPSNDKDSNDGAKLPSMFKQDQPVTVLADNLAYDGGTSLAVYTGSARLFQADTTIKGNTITIDENRGDLTAVGNAMSSTVREQEGSDHKVQRTRSTGSAADLKYEDGPRLLTYTGGAHLVGPEGDITAAKIQLYLQAEGDDVDRAEAYADAKEKMTLRETNRTTTGVHMTYTADNETYVVTGIPATVIDDCGRETIGKTLTLVKSTDTIVVDGNQQIRTQTKGGSGKCQ
jgi:lipopolysaccharide transport protein LptA